MVSYFGIRHLSPVCAYFLREFLTREKPGVVLIEGPSDLSELMEGMLSPEAKMPAAILAYTKETPIQTVLYPFAEFSPEYQAVLWAKENGAKARFCDLPSGAALYHYQKSSTAIGVSPEPSVYEQIEKITGVPHDSFWEYTFEQCQCLDVFMQAIYQYGKLLREFTEEKRPEEAEYEALRESYMRRVIAEAIEEFPDQNIVVVTGAFHTDAVQQSYTDEDRQHTENLSMMEGKATLMPYSYYRLSEHSGYGAGAKSPCYFEMLWRSRRKGMIENAGTEYLTRLAEYQRKHGYAASSAQVIEALRLARELAKLHGGKAPALTDLRDAAVTCLGEGYFSQISIAVADTEIGTKIGEMPESTVCTSVQEDFNHLLKQLKLEKYRSATAQELELDLRENLRVKSEEAAFLDLHRSFFLHRLFVLEIGFAQTITRKQDNATWAEKWSLRWTPEAEIRIVEASLKGDTIEEAAVATLGDKLLAAETVKETTQILAISLKAGLIGCVREAIAAVQRQAASDEAIRDIGSAIGDLSMIVRYGNIRRIDTAQIEPLLSRLFLKFCLNLSGETVCDAQAAREILPALETVWDVVNIHPFLDRERLVSAFLELADYDMANPLLSGFACGALTERGDMGQEMLYELMARHLSQGMPAADGAAWFEGFAERNHRALISRLGIWEKLAEYVAELDEEEFKATVLCLRRTFSTFTSAEKQDIAENICEVLGLSGTGGEMFVTATLSEQEQKSIEELDDFDFDF